MFLFVRPFCNNTTDHECDLSSFVWESEQHYLDALSVTVTAVQEGNQSELVESQLFTFNSLKTASLTCKYSVNKARGEATEQ